MSNRTKELFDQMNIKGAGFALFECDTICEKSPVGDIDHNSAEGFIHGDDGMTVSPDSFLGTERLTQGFAKANSYVFDRVVVVDFRIPSSAQLQVHETMRSEKREHVIHKRDACVDLGCTFPIEL